jgi:succinylglutamate desuccinylase
MEKNKFSEKRQGMLDSFEKKIHSLEPLYCVEKIDDCVYGIHPHSKNESFSLTFLGVVHGNEVSGFFILMDFLEYLLRVKPELPFSVGIALGNLKAFKADKRFVESDLNRSFGSQARENWEQRRAFCLEKLLSRTKFLLDFHQTQRPSSSPFFVFPYTKNGLFFAAQLSSKIPIVTHWGAGFSKDGMCTDEFVNSKGGTGVTLETGFCGDDPLQISFGFSLMIKAIFYNANQYRDQNIELPEGISLDDLSLYTWSLVFPYPENSFVQLKENLHNFMYIEKETILGKKESLDFKSPEEGYLLFPKYVLKGDSIPKELFRLVKKISPKNLP